MRHLLNTLFVTSEDIYLSLDNENVVINRNGTAIKNYRCVCLSRFYILAIWERVRRYWENVLNMG